jgi:transcriptional regulator with XRE-family HTH domain
MTETTTLGADLRRERERQGLTLRAISEKTKVSVGLLEGLESDDISRWPGGIFRRAFVRSYAQCVGLDADDVVRRFEQQHQPSDPEPIAMAQSVANGAAALHGAPSARDPFSDPAAPLWKTRLLGTAADLTVAAVLAFGSAAAGSRLLWPVLLIAVYYAAGILLTGTSPMVALLGQSPAPAPVRPPATAAEEPAPSPPEARPANERRHQPRRTNERLRQRRGVPARAQS